MSLWITKHCHAQQLNMLLPHVEETSLNADISITLLCSTVHLPGIVLLLVCCVGLLPLLWGQKMLYVLSAVIATLLTLLPSAGLHLYISKYAVCAHVRLCAVAAITAAIHLSI